MKPNKNTLRMVGDNRMINEVACRTHEVTLLLLYENLWTVVIALFWRKSVSKKNNHSWSASYLTYS